MVQTSYEREKKKLHKMLEFLEQWKHDHPHSNSGDNLRVKRMFELRIREQSDKVRDMSEKAIPTSRALEAQQPKKPAKEQSIFIDIEDTPDTRNAQRPEQAHKPKSFFSQIKAKFQGETKEQPAIQIPNYLDNEKKSAEITQYLKTLVATTTPATLTSIASVLPSEKSYAIRLDNLNRVLDYNHHHHKFPTTEILPLDTSVLKKLISNGRDPKPFITALLKVIDKILPPLDQLFTPDQLKQINACNTGTTGKSPRATMVLALARLHLQDLKVALDSPIHLNPKKTKNYRNIQDVLEKTAIEMNDELSHNKPAPRPMR